MDKSFDPPPPEAYTGGPEDLARHRERHAAILSVIRGIIESRLRGEGVAPSAG